MELTKERLEDLIEQATVDCYGDYECLAGFCAVFEDNLGFPFPAKVVGEDVEVIAVDQKASRIQAVCMRNGRKYDINILDLGGDSKKVKGWEWIETFRQWAKYL